MTVLMNTAPSPWIHDKAGAHQASSASSQHTAEPIRGRQAAECAERMELDRATSQAPAKLCALLTYLGGLIAQIAGCRRRFTSLYSLPFMELRRLTTTSMWSLNSLRAFLSVKKASGPLAPAHLTYCRAGWTVSAARHRDAHVQADKSIGTLQTEV